MAMNSSPADADPDLTAGQFRALAAARLRATPPADDELGLGSDFDLNPEAITLVDRAVKAAAVLVPVIARAPLTILLTERTSHLSAHAGQIAFPGGKIEPGDTGPLAAALRETNEEIGLDCAAIEPLGYLDRYRTGTGYLITPVVALVSADAHMAPDPSEVAGVFEVPFAFLMREQNQRIDSRHWRGAERRFYAMPYEDHYIWGATAGIIRMLHRRLFGK